MNLLRFTASPAACLLSAVLFFTAPMVPAADAGGQTLLPDPPEGTGQTTAVLLEIPESRFQFDPVPEGTELHHDFKLINRGTVPVTILNVRTG